MMVFAGSTSGCLDRIRVCKALSYPCSQTSGSTDPPVRTGDDPDRAALRCVFGYQAVEHHSSARTRFQVGVRPMPCAAVFAAMPRSTSVRPT